MPSGRAFGQSNACLIVVNPDDLASLRAHRKRERKEPVSGAQIEDPATAG